jgi:thiol-disulfide isomerase/thioredoxin
MGMAVLGGAVILALGVTLFLLLSSGGDDDPPAAPGDSGTIPVPTSDGDATPVANTGVLEPNRPEVGEVAPNFALPDAREPARVRQLADFRGQVVVLNFWATWCGPCKREMPEFEAAQRALGDEVAVVGVNYRESPEAAVAFLDDLEATFSAVIDGDGEVAEHYRVRGLPVTYFLDREGVVRHIEIGEVSAEELGQYLTEAGAPYQPAN